LTTKEKGYSKDITMKEEGYNNEGRKITTKEEG
jgi:hypothetical protein